MFMFMQPTVEKLYAMKLTGVADALRQQIGDSATCQLSFEERLSLLVDRSISTGPGGRTRPWHAAYTMPNCAAMLAWRTSTGITQTAWIVPCCATWPPPIGSASTNHLLITGPTGAGKSFLAAAFAQKACRDGFTVLHLRSAKLARAIWRWRAATAV